MFCNILICCLLLNEYKVGVTKKRVKLWYTPSSVNKESFHIETDSEL